METIAGVPVREYHRRYYYKRRADLIAYLGDSCAWCGTKDDLQFDHIDPDQKSFNIGENMTVNNPATRTELDKCQLLCRDCHIEKTRAEQLEIGFRHGQVYAWMKRHCRCDLCESAKREWYDERNARRREEYQHSSRGPRKRYGRVVDHGDPLCYTRGCRCDLCRAANSRRERERKAAKAA